MKRSEMLKWVALNLKLTGNHYSDDGRDLNDAEKILYSIEKLGMLPPAYNKPTPVNEIFPVHAWEPEE